ncbi:MAG: fumarylacetoacetate hydrolase family protein [Chloroherpetonaceae bacterium]|nr:fumarylacetoacetate hydrolase family protein [Chloroherpetonaceae bacterium]
MKFCTIRNRASQAVCVGVATEEKIFPTRFGSMIELLETCQNDFSGIEPAGPALSFDEVEFLACVPRPRSIRDFYAFEAHVRNARQKRGLEVPPEWYEFPVFYFSNHQAVIGPFEPLRKPRWTAMLDYELELACVIGKNGINISREEAEEYIAGYCIMNDWSARDEQMREVKVGLGPAKGKDFATTLGAFLVTKDELSDRKVGEKLDLEMEVYVNSKRYGGGNFKTIHYSFAQMIERASRDVRLYAGDVIGSGTVGTGCLLELDNTQYPYLEIGDVVEMRIERLGYTRNQIV